MSNWSLRSQVISLVLIVALAMLGTLGSSAYFALDSQMFSNIKNKAHSVASITADNLIPGIEFNDKAYIKEVINAVFNDTDVRGVLVFDSTSTLIYSHVTNDLLKDQIALLIGEKATPFRLDEKFFQATSQIDHRGESLGQVHLILTTEHQKAAVANTLNLIVGLAISLLLVTIGIGLFAARKILSPIETLKTASLNIKNSETLIPIETNNLHRDFLALGQAFNEMQNRLKIAFKELAESRDQLDVRVKERTKQLVEEIKEREKNEVERTERLARVQAQRDAVTELTTNKVIANEKLSRACEQINEICATTLDVGRVGIWMFSESGESIICADIFDQSSNEHSVGMIIERDEAPLYFEHLSNDRILACDDARNDPNTSEFTDSYLIPHGITSMMDVSIRVAGKLIGILCFEHVGPMRHWHSDEIKFADEVAAQTGQVFAESKRREIAKEKRILDVRFEKAQRMESLGVLAGGVAHDLNNMLGPVVGYTELLLRGDIPDKNIRKKIERIATSATNAADVIQDLLALARRGRYEMTQLQLNEVVERYCDSPAFIEMLDKRPGIKFTISLTDEDTALNGSTAHLEKVIMNLIHNAAEAIQNQGSIVVSTELIDASSLEHSKMDIFEGKYVALRVRDSGSGIAPEDLEKIFEPYFSKKVMGNSGSGLGLSVVYGIVKDHKGYYDIKSEIETGTEFILYFPRSVAEYSEKNEDQQFSTNDINNSEATILVVDDSPEQREIAEAILENLGYKVYVTKNGHEGIDFLKTHDVDLVTLDMIMEEDFDGLDTFQEILKFKPNQRTIVVSGYSATNRVQSMLELGASCYVKKPYKIATINNAIQKALTAAHSGVSG